MSSVHSGYMHGWVKPSVENRGEITAMHYVCNRQVMTKGWLYNPVTTKPAHREEKPQMIRETEKVLNIRVWEGETEKKRKHF